MGCANNKPQPTAEPAVQARPSSPASPSLASPRPEVPPSLPVLTKEPATLLKGVKIGGTDHAKLILNNPGLIVDAYDIERQSLSERSCGSVSKARSKQSGVIRAVKTIPKSQVKDVARFKQRIATMRSMEHRNIIKLHETFEDHKNVYHVMDLCTGGELFDKIIDAAYFTEVQAALLMQQIVRAVAYMHENNVAHRDLKPENFLFLTKDPIESNVLKLVDFGTSCKVEYGQLLSTKVGTAYYTAPQVLEGEYDHLGDLWSCGVIMYVMLCGYPPFFGETDAEVFDRVRLGNFSFNAADWKFVSEDAKELIRHLLKMKPKDRYSAEQALNHEWLKNKASKAQHMSLPSSFVDNLRSFRAQNKLKNAAMHIIATQLNEEQIKGLRETFALLDDNDDELLTMLQMKEGVMKAGVKDIPADIQQVLEDVDSGDGGVIDYTEFLAATLDKRLCMKEDTCWSAFRVFDKDCDGKIRRDELRQVLDDSIVREVLAADSLQQVTKKVERNADQLIEFEEFLALVKAKPSSKAGH